MNTLPKALLLAEMIDSNEVCVDWDKDAAAELRRLHEVNQGLLKTLESYEAENEKLWGLINGAKTKEQT